MRITEAALTASFLAPLGERRVGCLIGARTTPGSPLTTCKELQGCAGGCGPNKSRIARSLNLLLELKEVLDSYCSGSGVKRGGGWSAEVLTTALFSITLQIFEMQRIFQTS
jgi:hypothetical protein